MGLQRVRPSHLGVFLRGVLCLPSCLSSWLKAWVGKSRRWWKEGRPKGINLHDGSDKKTHQHFVHNMMLMGHPSVKVTEGFKKCLSIFSKASGLEVNNEKYQVLFFNTPWISQRNILRILGFQESSLPSKYLSAPLAKGVIQKVLWAYLLDIMRRKMAN